MGLFSSILNLAGDVIKTPLSVGEDIINLTDIENSHPSKTKENVKDIGKDLEDIFDDIF